MAGSVSSAYASRHMSVCGGGGGGVGRREDAALVGDAAAVVGTGRGRRTCRARVQMRTVVTSGLATTSIADRRRDPKPDPPSAADTTTGVDVVPLTRTAGMFDGRQPNGPTSSRAAGAGSTGMPNASRPVASASPSRSPKSVDTAASPSPRGLCSADLSHRDAPAWLPCDGLSMRGSRNARGHDPHRRSHTTRRPAAVKVVI